MYSFSMDELSKLLGNVNNANVYLFIVNGKMNKYSEEYKPITFTFRYLFETLHLISEEEIKQAYQELCDKGILNVLSYKMFEGDSEVYCIVKNIFKDLKE